MKATEVLYNKYQDLFDFAKDTVGKSLNVVTGQNVNTLEKLVTLLHFARASYLLDAISKLCLEGLATEAMVILRSLLNLHINIKWLTTGNSKTRFERYADFEVIYRKLAIDEVIKHGDIWDEIKNDDFTIHDKDFERIKKKYKLKKRKDFFNWSGKSIFQMAKEKDVNLEKEYKIIYGRLSSLEHTGPESVRDYLDDSERGKTKIKARPRDENIDLVLLTSLEYYFNVKAITHKIFDTEWPNLESVRQQFLHLRSKYWVNETNKIKRKFSE
jgi:hypothetical protein